MINTAEVILWGTRIGILHINKDKPYVSFEYDRDFIKSGIEVSPIKMPLSERVYEFPELSDSSFHGAPGLVSDSLPDKFGNKIIERWLYEQGRSLNDFNVIDRLCYTGKRGMGALEYIPASGPESHMTDELNIRKMVDFASNVLTDRVNRKISADEEVGYSQLVQLGTSAGGARAKALIAWNEETNEMKSGQVDAGDGFGYWLMKFDGVTSNGDHDLEDSVEYTLIEYAYYLMAIGAGIRMQECRIYEDDGLHHFMTRRFDRKGKQKSHVQTLAALAHIDYNYPGLCSYEQAAQYMRELRMPASDIEQLFRRMIFNVMLVNQDDHVKNISFLMDRNGKWSLAPAYDMTFSYNSENRWLKAHQMLINGKSTGITRDDIITAGRNMGIGKVKCDRIISDVEAAVKDYKLYFEQAGVKESTCDELLKVVSATVEPIL